MRAEHYWVIGAPYGKLAIMPRPRAGDWLVDELISLQASGVDVVVSLLTNEEITNLGLQHEPAVSAKIGLKFLAYPIVDRDVPKATEGFLSFANELQAFLIADRGVAIHCRMGIGRSSLVAACLLVKTGLSARDAFDCISRARGVEVPDTKVQIEWVASMTARLRDG